MSWIRNEYIIPRKPKTFIFHGFGVQGYMDIIAKLV